jgi:natural product biosynthesis luciferase-like monooxygenase protein
LRRGHQILGVVTEEPQVVEWARGLSIQVLADPSHLPNETGRHDFDLLLSVAYLSIIPTQVLALPKVAAVNFHDAPLPSYAGVNAPAWALMNREQRHGITWHLMTAAVDEGDILLERSFEIAGDETSLSLNLKCYQAAIESFDELLDMLEQGRLVRRKQDLDARRYYSKTRRPPAACTLMWDQDAGAITATSRALDFGDYENPLGLPKLFVGDEWLVVQDVRGAEASSGAPHGTILEASSSHLTIAAAGGQVVLRDFKTLYGNAVSVSSVLDKLGRKAGDRLPRLDDASAARLTDRNAALCRHESYWVKRLAQHAAPVLPYAKRAPLDGPDDVDAIDVPLPETFAARLQDSFGTLQPDVVLVAAHAAYLSRLTGQSAFDLAFQDDALRTLVNGIEALFSADVPVRLACSRNDRFETWLPVASAALHDVREKGTFARDVVVRYPQLKPLAGSDPCASLPVAVNVIDSWSGYRPSQGRALTVLVNHRQPVVRWIYNPNVLSAHDVALMREQFRAFLSSLAEDPRGAISDCDILGPGERHRLLVEWNATSVRYPITAVHRLIEEQVDRTPHSNAVSFEAGRLTYAELNRRANQLAWRVKEAGIDADGVVGIYLERSIDMVVAVLASLKAGGAYLPLDPGFPAERVRFMLDDATPKVVLTSSTLADKLTEFAGTIIRVDRDESIPRAADVNLPNEVRPEHLAYVIYTSGSTGRAKGVLVEHRNVLNFFAGMDATVAHDTPGVWLATTSLSFDISVLELLWTLSRGFEVVLYSEQANRRAVSGGERSTGHDVDLSLFYFASDEGENRDDKYRLLVEGAKFADANGFTAMWTPERHFHAFGGLYPNPSVAGAALAVLTERVGIRAGSCVLPLHNPIRVAEEWALVDNLSKGRVGISFASGWQPGDFVLQPEKFANRQRIMYEEIEVVRRLWRGEVLPFKNGRGEETPVRTLPRPIQPELPTWITAAGNPETFRAAGQHGFNLLTHLLGQSLDELAAKIAVYRDALADRGNPTERGTVTLMLHTFVGADLEQVRAAVRQPMKQYLRSAVDLIQKAAWSFPTFKQATLDGEGRFTLDRLSEDELDAILELAFERYFESSGLFGTPAQCAEMLRRVKAIGVDEVACLIDFGVPTATVLEHFRYLREVRELRVGQQPLPDDFSIPALIARHGVTHLQCTPSMARLLIADPASRRALGKLRHLLIGGEVFPIALADVLHTLTSAEILNMYGPTETTVWSSVHRLNGDRHAIPIGRPIANTRFYVLDESLRLVPTGVVGELFIAGDGVARGYHNRPDLTAERFIPDPFADGGGVPRCMYRTGDLVRYRADGTLDILGRLDHQVKIRGYRIEIGEIEAVLESSSAVENCAVVARQDGSGEVRLVSYVVPRTLDGPDLVAKLRDHASRKLPEWMVPSTWVVVEKLPLTPNGKVDRRALPEPPTGDADQFDAFVPPRDIVEEVVARIWADVLNVDRIGRTHSFFELGGHSLLAMHLVTRLREIFNVDLPLRMLFRAPTVAQLVESMTPLEPAPGFLQQAARLFQQVESMSDDEVDAALSDKSGAVS